jgi:selenide, water dikinase
LSQQALAQVLRQLPISTNRNVLVNSDTADDAGVFRLDRRRALVQTVDFFTPIVDDPVAYGQIAAANAFSDVFAMGGRPLTALNIMGFPVNLVPQKTIIAILRGGLEKASEVGCAIVGGHSIRNPEPIYGLAVTGIVEIRRLTTNATAKPGDALVLTKPLGTGIVTTGIKRALTSRKLREATIKLMAKVNSVGTKLAQRRLVHAATDITGFGLTGHLASMCRASGVSAVLDPHQIPMIDLEILDLIAQDCIPGGTRDNLELTRETVDWGNTDTSTRTVLTDAQTSGGLLLAVSPRNLSRVLTLLKRDRAACAKVIGQITRSRHRLICMNA